MTAKKRKISRDEQTFELSLEHSDIRDLMNDPQVLLDGGGIASTQVMTVIHRKAGGSESRLKEFSDGDTIVFTFKKIDIIDNTTTYTDVDIS